MPSRLPTLCAAVLLAGCAAAGPPVAPAVADGVSAPAAPAMRVLVRLSAAQRAAEPGAAAIAAWAQTSAARPVRHAAAAGDGWHALELNCAPADCDAALARLAADTAHFESVQREQRRRALAP